MLDNTGNSRIGRQRFFIHLKDSIPQQFNERPADLLNGWRTSPTDQARRQSCHDEHLGNDQKQRTP